MSNNVNYWMTDAELEKFCESNPVADVTAKDARHLQRITDVITDIKSGGGYEVYKSIFLLWGERCNV